MEINLEQKRAWKIRRRTEIHEYYRERLGNAEFTAWMVFGTMVGCGIIILIAWIGGAR